MGCEIAASEPADASWVDPTTPKRDNVNIKTQTPLREEVPNFFANGVQEQLASLLTGEIKSLMKIFRVIIHYEKPNELYGKFFRRAVGKLLKNF